MFISFVISLIGIYCWTIPQSGDVNPPCLLQPDEIDYIHYWAVHSFQDESLVLEATVPETSFTMDKNCILPESFTLPSDWQVLDIVNADLTGDGEFEYGLLVKRPWFDWPLMRWTDHPSPIAGHRDVKGYSCHIILAVPPDSDDMQGYELVWAGSALAQPITEIAVADTDKDGMVEMIALESSYEAEGDSPAQFLSVWRWNGFGFSLVWRSTPGQYRGITTLDIDHDGVVEVLTR